MHRLRVLTHGGVQDLSRVVNVLALLDLHPLALTAHRRAHGLEIEADLPSDDRQVELCRARLLALSSVEQVCVPTLGD